MPETHSGNYWPSQVQETLLRAALLPGADAIEAWSAVRSQLDLDRVDRASRRLLPLLADNLRRLGIDWPRLYAQAQSRKFIVRARTMLAYLRRTFAAPVPDEALTSLAAAPVSRFERFEYRICNRPQGLLGELPTYWCNDRRLWADGQATSPLGFPRYLQQTWRLGSLAGVARGAFDRARGRVRAAVFGVPGPVRPGR